MTLAAHRPARKQQASYTVNWVISGANVVLNEPGHTCYDTSTSCIFAVQLNLGMAVVMETFDEHAQRRSEIKAIGQLAGGLRGSCSRRGRLRVR